ncbi:MAG TPA: response regulator [Paucimonas sp.]|nr:response regulator [Paucimonas sp.]HJW54589.1 response regulator [Burkholderiaceae bacterium]
MSNAKNQKIILIVDDSRVSRMLTRQFILSMRADWMIEEAVTGEEAVDKLDTVTPDLILLDVNMPGMGGLAAVEKLREKSPSVNITLMTANVQDATRNKASALRVGFIEKPVTEARIQHIIAILESA